MGDHTEVVEVVFDPERISYEELLHRFFAWHNPHRAMPRQYRSVILAADEEQWAVAERVLDHYQRQSGSPMATVIEQLDTFYVAEDYHQKFYLQNRRDVVALLDAFYGSRQAWFVTRLAGQLNAIVGGELPLEEFQASITERGLTDEEIQLALEIVDLL